jgi:hypothetical protein
MKRERFCLRMLGFTHEGTLRHRVFFRDRFWSEEGGQGMIQFRSGNAGAGHGAA